MNFQLVKKASSALALAALLSFNQDDAPARITFEAERLYPEGITFDEKRNLVYLSSLTQGKLSSVDKDGNYKIVCEDQRLLRTVGVKYNNRTGKLFAANNDQGQPAQSGATVTTVAQLAIVDVASSKLETVVDLSKLVTANKRMLNDLTIDNEDNVYVTDSYAHVIYKVDKNNKASVFSQSPLFKPDSNTLGLNGIAYHSKGNYLLVAKSVEGSILKVSIKDPSKVEKVKLPEPLVWGDGIYFTSEKDLVVVRNRFSKTVFLHSEDNWASATIVKEEKASDLMPTTATAYNGNVYVINSRLSEIKDNKPTKQFVIDVYKSK